MIITLPNKDLYRLMTKKEWEAYQKYLDSEIDIACEATATPLFNFFRNPRFKK